MVVMFEAGTPVAEIADITGRNRSTVLEHLKRAGVDTGYSKLPEALLDELVRRYEGGVSTPELADEFGVHKDTVRRRLVVRGVRMRDHRFGK